MSICGRGIQRAAGLLVAVVFTTNHANASYVVERVAIGLNQPTYVTQAPGDNSHLYIVERVTPDNSPGRILKYSLIDGTSAPLYQFPSGTTSGDGGVLMMAFHPDFATNGKFYATSEFLEGSTYRNRVQEFIVDQGGTATLARTLLQYDNFSSSHSVDWLGFDPLATGADRNNLYITMGDGGIQIINPNFVNRAQNLSLVYGKMLRVDVSDGTDAYESDPNKNFAIPADNPYANDENPNTLGEVFASGFRNPYRASFDRATGDLFIGDVGFQAREEIDFLKAGTSGQDFGWAKREGTLPSPDPDHTGPQGDSLNPIYEYVHPPSFATPIRGFSITGGYVYRGSIPELQGRYFFADFVTTGIYSTVFDRDTDPATFNGLNMTGLIDHTASLNAAIIGGGEIDLITSFGEDNAGNLYIVDFGDDPDFFPDLGEGEIFRIVPDILRGDYNRDGTVNAADYTVWRDTMGYAVASGESADGNFTGTIDEGDYQVWLAHFGESSLGTGANSSVPEPTTQSLALLALTFGGWIEVRRRIARLC